GNQGGGGVTGLLAKKLDQAQAILAEFDLDAWMIFVRESGDGGDPALPLVYDGSFTWQSVLIVTRSGERIAIVGKFDDGAVRATGVWTEIIPYVEGIREPLINTIRRMNPRTIALDYSLDDHAADGLAHGMYLLLVEYFVGPPYAERFVSADRVVGALRGRKSPEEIQRMQAAIDTAEQIFAEVGRFAAPGKSEREIAAFMLAAAKQRGVEPAWSGPCPIVNSGPHSMIGHGVPSDLNIEPGHVLHIDFGVKQAVCCSDLQRCWYVPRDSETAPPAAVQKACDAVVKGITAGATVLKPGVEGWQVDAASRSVITSAGYPEYGHALGHHVG